MSISGCYYQGSSRAHSKFSLSPSSSPPTHPPFFYLLPLIFPLSHTLLCQALMYITSSDFVFFPLSLTLSLPFTHPPNSLPCNLICFSFIHPLHRQCNERLIEVETLFGRLPLSLSLELIAVLQSVWFDFIGAIWFSNVTFGVWLKPRREPNWEILLSSCCCHSHRAGNKDLAAFYFSVFLPLINVFARLHTKSFSHSLLFSITALWYSLILHTHHLNSQQPICQHVETPLKHLYATSEKIGLDLDMIIIPVCWHVGCAQHRFYVIPVISKYTFILT